MAGHVADDQPDPAAGEGERVVPVAADGGSLGRGQVAHREVQPGDLRQRVGQQGALQRFGDGVLAGEGVGVGQPHRQPAAEFLHHRDVRLGERRTPGSAVQRDDAEGPRPASSGVLIALRGLHELHDAHRVRLGPGPGGHLGGGVT